MFTSRIAHKLVSFATIGILTVVTSASASDLTTKRVLGSVSAVGMVEVRGVTISPEGTVFSGDRIRSGPKAYAKLILAAGPRLELSEKTDIVLESSGSAVQIALLAGGVGFAALNGKQARFSVAQFEITGGDAAAGHLAFTGAESLSVRALRGKLTVQNSKTRESYAVVPGASRVFGLKNQTVTRPIAELASALPVPLPAVPPAPQGGGQPSGGGMSMDAGGWVAVGAAIGGAVTAIAALVIANDKADQADADAARKLAADVQALVTTLQGQLSTALTQLGTTQGQVTTLQTLANNLQSQIASLQTLTNTLRADQTTLRSALTSLQNAVNLSVSAVQTATTANQVTSVGTDLATAINASVALSPAQRTQFAAQASQIISQANEASLRTVQLQQQISNIQSEIARTGQATADQQRQLAELNAQLNAERERVNDALRRANELAENARRADPGITAPPPLNTVPPPPFASASQPT